MTDIRTPESDPDKPIPWLYAPFLPGRIYHAATYGPRIVDGERRNGHSSGAIDLNRRVLKDGVWQWKQDLGDPVLAAQDGKVARVDKPSGTVELDHGGGWRTRYVHMQNIGVKVGDRVDRGDQLGEVGNRAGGPASSFGPHLHFQVLRNGKPVQVRFEGQPVRTSVIGSDTRPATWDPPDPVAVVGPPPRATWEGAYREAAKRLDKALEQRDAARAGRDLATEERDAARAEAALLTTTVAELRAALTTAEAALVECRNAAPPDCTSVEAQLAAAHRKLVLIRDALDAA